jgi:hypothetical protein
LALLAFAVLSARKMSRDDVADAGKVKTVLESMDAGVCDGSIDCGITRRKPGPPDCIIAAAPSSCDWPKLFAEMQLTNNTKKTEVNRRVLLMRWSPG